MRVLSVVGARPQFVKLAPVHAALLAARHEHTIVHTGQHYDLDMSDAIFQDFDLPEPNVNLAIGSGTHAEMTSAILRQVDPVLTAARPDVVLVYGDTDSTLAAAVAAVKHEMRIAHVEAGLRSFNRAMPEEVNRVLTDHAADLLLAPTPRAMDNLANEGLAGRAVLTGDVMTDICLRTAERVMEHPPDLSLPTREFVLATIHRPYNTDDPNRLQDVLSALARIEVPVLLPAHPRLRARARSAGVDLELGSIVPIAPLDYSSMIYAAGKARAIVTDSGGLQKEAFILNVPCTTIRTETEWPETLEAGMNVLCFEVSDPDFARIAMRVRPHGPVGMPFGDGNAAARIVDALASTWPDV